MWLSESSMWVDLGATGVREGNGFNKPKSRQG